MTKNVNESQKDPERATSAKARKPPPNPWVELKALRRTAIEAADLVGRQGVVLQLATRRADLLTVLTNTQNLLIEHLLLPRFNYPGRPRQDRDFIARVQGDIFGLKNRLATISGISGNIAGLEPRPTPSNSDTFWSGIGPVGGNNPNSGDAPPAKFSSFPAGPGPDTSSGSAPHDPYLGPRSEPGKPRGII